MKPLKTKANSLVAKTLATSILFASCSKNPEFEQIGNEPNSFDEDLNDSKGVSISLSLSDETKRALEDITPLVQDVINNPEIAQEFAKDPETFCKQRGYGFVVDMDDAIFKIIVALGNREINEALRDNDFERFMQLCSDMKLLDEGQTVRLNTIFQSKEEQEIFNSIAYQLNGETIETRSVAFWLAVSVVVVIAIVLTYTVGIDSEKNVDNRRTAINRNNSLEGQAVNPTMVPQYHAFLHCSNPTYSFLDIWALKDKQVTNYQLASNYKTFLSQQIVSYLKENKPAIFERFTETQISEFLKSNMIV